MSAPARSSAPAMLAATIAILYAHAALSCEVRARTSAGWVCGSRRIAGDTVYASFRGVPYAKQPLGELRFQELQPPEPWSDPRDATVEGPICPQADVLYGPLMTPRAVSEACIHANIHVPIDALPDTKDNSGSPISPPAAEGEDISGLPILVFVHGGGFAFGSGDADLHGPENLVRSGVIVVTFNYRLNVFGFLSLNSTKIPGNNGLRDMVTLLRWVRDNARNFGGNPDRVTIMGQSAGAAAAHLLTLSPLAQGLFNKAVIMSGTALPLFYATTPAYAKYISDMLFKALRIKTTDPDQIHQQLVDMPLDTLMAVNKALQNISGVSAFFPVIESPLPGVKAVLPEDTQKLLEKGYGKDIALLIGFTNMECESFRKRFLEIDMMERIKANPLFVVSPTVSTTFLPEVAKERAMEVEHRYFNGSPSIDKFLKICTETYFQYPALKVAEYRAKSGGAPTYMYQFAYDADNNPVRKALDLNYTGGAGHVEDLTYVFKVNSVRVPQTYEDQKMKELMTNYIVKFIHNGKPTCEKAYLDSWLPIDMKEIRYLTIRSPTRVEYSTLTPEQTDMMKFFDNIMSWS